MKFKKPKNGHFYEYCFSCRHYAFEQQIGCAYIGKCTAINGEETTIDAYDPPCGLWSKNRVEVKEGMARVKDYPPYLDYPKERKKITNADKIRQMTDEELATLLATQDEWTEESPDDMTAQEIYDTWLDWLKQEVE